MNPSQDTKRTKKIVTSFILIFSVVIIAVVVSTLSNNKSGTTSTAPSTITNSSPSAPSTDRITSSSTAYKDGAYSASDSYETPGGTEQITVSATVKDSAISAISLKQSANNHDSRDYQDMFEQGYQSYVLGKPLNSISLSRVSGASLTTGGFNAALEQIKNQAQQ